MADNILELRNIGKTFSGVNVLRDVNLAIRRGEVHALLGENGAGKSTLIKIISGYYQPDKDGEILINGSPVAFRRPKDAMNAHIHTIYQELALCPDMTVAENIVMDKLERFPGFIQKQSAYREMAAAALKRLGQDDIDPAANLRTLSIAKQQIVEIAKAITSNAEIILMDEPTSSISQKDAECLLGIVKTLRDEGVTIIYISHRLHEISGIADRITVLRDGGMVGTVDAKGTDSQALIQMMVGREVKNLYPKQDIELGELVLEVEGLASDVFEDVSFRVHKGEILGIGGLIGAKRTEILESLFGLRPITKGSVKYQGKPFMPKNPKHCIDNGIALVTEDRKKSGLVLCLPVVENINIVNVDKKAKHGVINWRELKAIAHHYREKLRVHLHSIDQVVSTLSGGNQQKVVLSKWMHIAPKLILFDEPTRGIDIGAKTEIYSVMGDLAKAGAAVVMVSSELPELISVTDQIVVMCEGKMTGCVPQAQATQEYIMRLAAQQIH